MSVPNPSDAVQFRRFVQSYEALGILVDFVSSRAPFDELIAGGLISALKHQIGQGTHVCAFRGETLVGYSGWLPITEELGRMWLAGKAELEPVPADRANALALTIVCADNPRIVRGLIRASRKLTVGQRAFFRRNYVQAVRPVRRNTVLNFSQDQA